MGFNSLQTGKRIASYCHSLPLRTGDGICFNSLQTGKRIASHRTRRGRIRGIRVSIPFKRERGSQVNSQATSILAKQFQFPSNGNADRKLAWMCDYMGHEVMFQFPSNGKADRKEQLHSQCNGRRKLFQFPSNGNADRKRATPWHSCDLRIKGFNSLQTGTRIARPSGKSSRDASGNVRFQFPSNGNADRKLLLIPLFIIGCGFQFPSNGNADRKDSYLILRKSSGYKSFNSLQTGTRIAS